jgi:DNA processing protein
VLGCGIDIVYPPRNAALLAELCEKGLVLSEFALGTPPHAHNFPRRNRIIAGLARGCLVVEAAMQSGSLITARLANEIGRDVFAIPGSIHSPLSKGPHLLIKQGAKLVDDVADVLDELGIAATVGTGAATRPMVSPDAAATLAALGHDACDFDTLASRTGLTTERLSAALTELELETRVARNADGTLQRLD